MDETLKPDDVAPLARELPEAVWAALRFVPPEDGADWKGAVRLELMYVPEIERDTQAHELTARGDAVLGHARDLAGQIRASWVYWAPEVMRERIAVSLGLPSETHPLVSAVLHELEHEKATNE